mmetsp:Transcript_401/g.786  ORF Transcript_401/g.786 Transcript_401/m.786 type:complete len:259 (+) Transcript_401:2935-3711(+)
MLPSRSRALRLPSAYLQQTTPFSRTTRDTSAGGAAGLSEGDSTSVYEKVTAIESAPSAVAGTAIPLMAPELLLKVSSGSSTLARGMPPLATSVSHTSRRSLSGRGEPAGSESFSGSEPKLMGASLLSHGRAALNAISSSPGGGSTPSTLTRMYTSPPSGREAASGMPLAMRARRASVAGREGVRPEPSSTGGGGERWTLPNTSSEICTPSMPPKLRPYGAPSMGGSTEARAPSWKLIAQEHVSAAMSLRIVAKPPSRA